MRPLDFSIPRLICTLAPPPILRKRLAPPPVLITKIRTKIDDSYLLLSSSSPEPDGPLKGWLGPARQLTRYALAESETSTEVSLEIANAMRLFSQPTRLTNVTELGALGNPYFSRRPHLPEMLKACLLTPKGVRGLFEADVVADREVIKKFMFPHKASFNASYAHGVLFLEDAEEPLKIDTRGFHTDLGFLRACTEMYHKRRQRKPKGRVRRTFNSVVARQLGGLNLLMSGTVDCVEYKYTGDPGCYMNFVTRPLKDGKHIIRPKTWKEWYFRAHLMGVRSLFLGLVDEAGVLRHTRQLATRALPKAASAGADTQWDPEADMRWAARVLGALRDYCQEAVDLTEVANTHEYLPKALWRVKISPLGGEVRVLVRALNKEERQGTRLVPKAVLQTFEKGYD